MIQQVELNKTGLQLNIFLNRLPSFLQITDDNYVSFLGGWQAENKPRVILFDQVPTTPLIYKVSDLFTHRHVHTSVRESCFSGSLSWFVFQDVFPTSTPQQ